MRSTQRREYDWGSTCKKAKRVRSRNREYGRRDPSRWPRGTLCPQELVLTSPTSCGSSVGIVRSRTQATEFSFIYICIHTQQLHLAYRLLQNVLSGSNNIHRNNLLSTRSFEPLRQKPCLTATTVTSKDGRGQAAGQLVRRRGMEQPKL
jgi:hypothetical protein